LEVFPQPSAPLAFCTLGRRKKGAPGAVFLNEGGKAKTGMKELLYKNSIFTGWSVNNFILKNQWRIEHSIQLGKQTPNRVVSLVSLCSVVGRRRGKKDE
jgi:hypothetical protein